MALTESQMRDFVKQIIRLGEDRAQELKDNGYNPDDRLAVLKTESRNADEKEALQRNAMAEAKNATLESKKALLEAYRNASGFADIMSGILGKKHSLIRQIKKMRWK